MNAWEQYKVDLPEGTSGPWKISKFTVSEEDANFSAMRSMFSGGGRDRSVPAGNYTSLTRNGQIIMSDTPAEIRDHLESIRRATGNCLVNGLGLGMVVEAMLKNPEVTSVVVIEKSDDVIKLVAPTLLHRYGKKLTIIMADAYVWKPPKEMTIDVAWHDIWDNICSDNLPQMAKLHRKYGKRVSWQGSWGKELCQYQKRRGGCW